MNLARVAIFLLARAYAQDEDEPRRSVSCRDRDRPLSTELEDLYELTAAEIGQTVVLRCSYCKEPDNEEAKIWYKSPSPDNSTKTELKLDTNNDRNSSRIFVGIDHSLNILNITQIDSGYYSCFSSDWNEPEKKFNFFLDVVAVNSTNIEVGNLTTWANYSHDYFTPLNNLLRTSKGAEYLYLRISLRLGLELMTDWGEWGLCEICGRPQGEGIRKRAGTCALKIAQLPDPSDRVASEEERRFKELRKISCKSLILKSLVPGIYNTTSVIPDYELNENCQGACNPDAEGIYSGWKSTKKTGYKFRKTFVLTENSHLTLVCPESSLDNVVVWSRNGKKLPPGESVPPPKPTMEPKITVDTFNTLYLHEVTKEEEGNYTCQVDNVRMQQVIIFVVSKSRLLTQALLRHMMYLGFILSLTLSCYVSGLVITCTRKHRFKTYKELRQLNKNKDIFSEYVDSDEDDVPTDVLKPDPLNRKTIQVGSVFIQTCCGMRHINSDKTFKFSKFKSSSSRTSSSGENLDVEKEKRKMKKKYKWKNVTRKDVQHLLSSADSDSSIGESRKEMAVVKYEGP